MRSDVSGDRTTRSTTASGAQVKETHEQRTLAERGAFEDWAVRLAYATRAELAAWRNEFGYARKDLDHLWLGWQGRAGVQL
jgi:hypothetical protein